MSEFIRIGDRDLKVEGSLIRIARVDGEKYRFLDDPASIVEGLKAQGKRVDLFTFMQRLPETQPKYSYRMEWDNFAVLPITTFDHWWMKQIGFKARNKAKQAEKHGVTLREIPFGEELVRGIWEIYNETPVRQGKRFPHYGMTLEQVHRYAATFLDDSVFIGAFVGEKMAGFVKLTMDETRTQAGLMHIVSMVSERDKAPTNALVARAVRSCAERGITYLVYSNFAYGNKKSDSLSDFKERNGFQRMDIPRYYVPLTPLGWAAYRAGFHRRLTDVIPEKYIVKLREMRSNWYNRKLQSNSAL
ncbi:MAG TPA: hypothetical protein VGF82_24655 [Terracidiphilus sp.]|jgi:hypothetical protein